MIIFGTKSVTTTPEKGEFHCPYCDIKNAFRQRKVRQFFHLYFIPLIPLKQLGEYVECQKCKNTFNTGVKDYDPAAIAAQFEAEYHNAIKQVMIHILLADGVIEDSEVDSVSEVYNKLTGNKLGVRSVHEEIARVKNSNESLSECLLKLQGTLNDEGKETVIRSAMMIALADGEFQQEEQDLIQQIGKDIGMTPAHLQGVINTM